MPRLIDTHTHIYLPEFDSDRDDVIDRCRRAGVDTMIFPGVNIESLPAMKAVRDQYPDMIQLAAGIHPTDLEGADLGVIESELASGQFVAVGEIGLDLHWDTLNLDAQMQAFERQMLMAVNHSLPVIIHCREALDPLLEVIDGLPTVPRGVFHSFSGSAAEVDRIRSRGDFHFGLNGVATFKNCHVCDAIPEITLDRLLLETDAPWLAPTPHRGKRNEPAYIELVCRHIAASQQIDPDTVAQATTANAISLFALPV